MWLQSDRNEQTRAQVFAATARGYGCADRSERQTHGGEERASGVTDTAAKGEGGEAAGGEKRQRGHEKPNRFHRLETRDAPAGGPACSEVGSTAGNKTDVSRLGWPTKTAQVMDVLGLNPPLKLTSCQFIHYWKKSLLPLSTLGKIGR